MEDTIIPKWKPPPSNYYKVNVDGSARKQYAATAIVRDHKGTVIQGETQELLPYAPEESEALAFHLNLQLVKDFSNKSILIKGELVDSEALK